MDTVQKDHILLEMYSLELCQDWILHLNAYKAIKCFAADFATWEHTKILNFKEFDLGDLIQVNIDGVSK